MEKRILAVLIAAFAGTAAAQNYVTSGASGGVVRNGFGDCWKPGATAGSSVCPPTAAGSSAAPVAPRAQAAPGNQLAQANTPAEARVAATPRRTSSAADAAGRTAAANNPPPPPGYVGTGSAGVVATNPYGLCWRAGSDWSPDKAAAPCDAVPRASLAVPPVAAAPAPAPEPQPLAVAEPTPAPQPIVIEKVSLSTDVLFGFNKAELTPAGEEKLEQLARNAQGANVERVVLTGHADRIGSEEYNKDLSEKRAQAVADYLASKGVDSSRLQVAGRGESDPVTGNQCQRLGKESNKNQKLIACLQPDRRVDAELLGSRESTASSGTAPSATGSTGTSPSSGSAGSSGTSGSSSSSSSQ